MLYRLLTILDWAMIAASLFNTIAMLWLGLAVLLNAERRVWGTWMAGGGLILGALFFAGHTAVVGQVIGDASSEMIFYWRLGWLVLIVVPYLWYLVMAWYAGVLRPTAGPATGHRGERLRLATISALGLLIFGLALFVDPLPSYGELRQPPSGFDAPLGGAPVVRLLYPAFAALCIVLALAALRAPAGSERFMGDLARRRARPWLVAASLVLLALCLAVGAGAFWFFELVRSGLVPELTAAGLTMLIGFDLGACLLIAAAVVLIGQAVVAYEIFTGSSLPRGELARQWRRALIFAGGYGLAVGWSMSGAGVPDRPIYQILIATLLTTVFFALLGWRAFAERARTIEQLRPFVASQRLFERLTHPATPLTEAEVAPFRALAANLLGARVAYLMPLGPLAALAGAPLAEPPMAPIPAVAVAALAAALPVPPPLCLSIAPERHGGAIWAVPLHGERGLIGLLLLGEKRDGGLYTREEIEIARAAGERLIDAQAGSEMARRLVALQRRRLAEGQVLDRRTRRVLHDEVLPQIHMSILDIASLRPEDNGASGNHPEDPNREPQPAHADPRTARPTAQSRHLEARIAGLQSQLTAIHHQISDLLHELPPAVGADLARLGPLGALRRAVEAELQDAFDTVCWELTPAAEAAARRLDPINAEALYYAAREAVRNAARHGRGDSPTRSLQLTVRAAEQPQRVELVVEDNGVGLGAQRMPGAGAGRGLALHGTVLAIIGGALDLDSGPGRPTRVTLSVPLAAEQPGTDSAANGC